MTAVDTALGNPYWDAVKDHVDWSGRMSLWGTPLIDWCSATGAATPRRTDFVARYSWTITDPDTVAFVAGHARGALVDPMAGTGYWAKLLTDLGVDVTCYDAAPGTNHWHAGQPLHFEPVSALDAADAAALHPDRTLLLSWPPYEDDAGVRAVRAYRGGRVIFIGEGSGGCTGDDDLFAEFAANWVEVAERVPVQWYGMHDVVTVYDRAVAP